MSAETKLKKKLRSQERLMRKAAFQLQLQTENATSMQTRNDFWRNLLVASAFARGLGNERPISEIIEEAVPALMGINTPMVPAR